MLKINSVLVAGLFLFSLSDPLSVLAQAVAQKNVNWQNLDLRADDVFGISTEKAYNELLKNKKANSVIVAVIDGGVDVRHEDLKTVIWTNPNEIPGNGKDDDHNGYIDDVHGWNFYSTMQKGDEEFDISVLAKEINAYQLAHKETDSSKMSKKDLLAYQDYKLLKTSLNQKLQPLINKLKETESKQRVLEQILHKINKTELSANDFKQYIPGSAEELGMQMDLVNGLREFPGYVTYKKANLIRAVDYYKMQLAFYNNQGYDLITGGPTAYHGTHIAGIIAADRDNNIGIRGVADHVKIMVIRAIPGFNPIPEDAAGNEQLVLKGGADDKQSLAIAKSIRYATDNGAKVINMSLGESWAMTSQELREAIKYAVAKDVLIVHASGNKNKYLDDMNVYPDRKTPDGLAVAASWIEVGASGLKNDDKLAGKFSNYGNKTVDVYAPGVEIISTIPRSAYLNDTGTSMATPVVAGLAALIRAYYPGLTARQIKEIIMKTVIKAGSLKDKCISGGVVNAYNALQLAATY
ncbi:hypothetical protein TH53_12590 [Pedobacter lusitanus]|uniref:Peptidase S8/S53 domain-containing protein n=1 Tax=Pedobacter lusitanus TaxID=1503925 RepID=A0A0D0FWK2_9SPHI|nr:S8 family serine peptidase [Pedobacter lusitanus]KIO76839.1 hypothetical protein TH53_12590 [Pedobacter lusitanus]